MSAHLQREVDKLKRKILSLSAVVEQQFRQAVKSVEQRDASLAQDVLDVDIEIDQAEVDVEEECLKILALHQPVAGDLRFIIALLKINNDLERIGDLAVNIGEHNIFLVAQEPVETTFDFPGMATKCQAMLRKALDSLVNMDTALAREVCADDDEVDTMNRHMYEQVKTEIRKDVSRVGSLLHLLSISRHLERIADLATNIAEDVVYMAEGEIIRHRVEDFAPTQDKD